MHNLTVKINHRDYLVGCAEGEEVRIKMLAAKLDDYVNELEESIGQIGDRRLLVIAGIMLLDELETQRSSNSPKSRADTDEFPVSKNANDELINQLLQNNAESEAKLRARNQDYQSLMNWLNSMTERLEKLANPTN